MYMKSYLLHKKRYIVLNDQFGGFDCQECGNSNAGDHCKICGDRPLPNSYTQSHICPTCGEVMVGSKCDCMNSTSKELPKLTEQEEVLNYLLASEIPFYNERPGYIDYLKHGMRRDGIDYKALYREGMTIGEAKELMKSEYIRSLYERKEVVDYLIGLQIPNYKTVYHLMNDIPRARDPHKRLYTVGMTIEDAKYLASLLLSLYRGDRSKVETRFNDFVKFCNEQPIKLTVVYILDNIHNLINRYKIHKYRTHRFGNLDDKTNRKFNQEITRILSATNAPDFNAERMIHDIHQLIFSYFPNDQQMAERVFDEIMNLEYSPILFDTDTKSLKDDIGTRKIMDRYSF